MNGPASQVLDYLEGLDSERRAAISAVRSVILKVVPEAVESMRYSMPTYHHAGGLLCALASQKRYMSLYMDADLVETHRSELAGLSVGKSCIRFRNLEQLPLETVEMILAETARRLDIHEETGEESDDDQD